MIHRPAGDYHQRNCVFCLWFIIAQLVCLQYFCLWVKFTNGKLDWKTFDVDNWASSELPIRQ